MFKLWNFRFSNSFANKNLIWDWKLMKGITRVTSSFSVRIILLFKQIFSGGENSISIMLYSISHIVTYTPCSTYYLTSSTNWTPHLMENSIREPKIFLLSIFLRMKLCTCSKTSFSSDCDRFVFLKSKKRKYINYWTDYWMILTVTRI